MKLAIVGSRNLHVKGLDRYVREDVCEIVSGGAVGVDTEAAVWALENGLKLTVFFPEYASFGRAAPIKRNEQIAEYADEALVFWDGTSKGTRNIIKCFEKRGKKVRLINVTGEE